MACMLYCAPAGAYEQWDLSQPKNAGKTLVHWPGGHYARDRHVVLNKSEIFTFLKVRGTRVRCTGAVQALVITDPDCTYMCVPYAHAYCAW